MSYDECQFVIRIRGIPFSISKSEIEKFFDKSQLAGTTEECVQITYNEEGRPSGECFVVLADEDSYHNALRKHREYIGKRYVEVFESDWDDMSRALKKGADNRSHYGGTEAPIVKIRGLPFSVTEEQIKEFFEGLFIEKCKIKTKEDGEATGEGYVRFSRVEEASAALQKHMQKLGHRYLEIFKATTKEMKEEMPLDSQKPRTGRMDGSGGGAKGHKVQMRGIPFKASQGDLIKFFAPIMPKHLEVNEGPDGRPAGTATVFFHSHEDALEAMKKDRELMDTRYVELFLDSAPGSDAPDPVAQARALIAQAHGVKKPEPPAAAPGGMVGYPGYGAAPTPDYNSGYNTGATSGYGGAPATTDYTAQGYNTTGYQATAGNGYSSTGAATGTTANGYSATAAGYAQAWGYNYAAEQSSTGYSASATQSSTGYPTATDTSATGYSTSTDITSTGYSASQIYPASTSATDYAAAGGADPAAQWSAWQSAYAGYNPQIQQYPGYNASGTTQSGYQQSGTYSGNATGAPTSDIPPNTQSSFPANFPVPPNPYATHTPAGHDYTAQSSVDKPTFPEAHPSRGGDNGDATNGTQSSPVVAPRKKLMIGAVRAVRTEAEMERDSKRFREDKPSRGSRGRGGKKRGYSGGDWEEEASGMIPEEASDPWYEPEISRPTLLPKRGPFRGGPGPFRGGPGPVRGAPGPRGFGPRPRGRGAPRGMPRFPMSTMPRGRGGRGGFGGMPPRGGMGPRGGGFARGRGGMGGGGGFTKREPMSMMSDAPPGLEDVDTGAE